MLSLEERWCQPGVGWMDRKMNGWTEVGCVSQGVGYLAASESQLHSVSESRQPAQNSLLLSPASRNQPSISQKHHNSWEAVRGNRKARMKQKKQCRVGYYCPDTFGVRIQIIKVFANTLFIYVVSNHTSEANTAITTIPVVGHFSAFPPS